MRNKNWLMSDLLQRRLFTAKSLSSLPQVPRLLGKLLCVGMLMGVAALLSACPTLPTKPCETQALPSEPALSEPLPLVNYSLQAQSNTATWQKKLTDMHLTLKPVTTPGPSK